MVEPDDEQRESGDFDVTYACFLCGLSVDEDAPDLCAVEISSAGGSLQAWCHAGCVRDAAHDPEAFPDLVGTPEEQPPADPELEAASDALDGVLAEIRFADLDGPDARWRLARALAAAARPHDIEIDAAGEALSGVLDSLEFVEERDADATWALANALLDTALRHGVEIEVDELDDRADA